MPFDPKPLKAGGGWYIVVTYPSGMQEHIPGLPTGESPRKTLAKNDPVFGAQSIENDLAALYATSVSRSERASLSPAFSATLIGRP